MARLDEALTGGSIAGLAAGVGTAVLAPLVLPALGWVVRPIARVALQAGVEIYRGAVAPVGVAMIGLVTEARAELSGGRVGDAPAAASAAEERPAASRRRGTTKPMAVARDTPTPPQRTSKAKRQRRG